MNLTPTEKILFKDLEAHFQNIVFDCGCNDWYLNKTPENKKVVTKAIKYNYSARKDKKSQKELKEDLETAFSENRKDIFIFDLLLWGYLINKILK